jgi:hypothetical protein
VDTQEVQLENFDKTTLAQIFSHLDVPSLLNICETTQQFKEIVQSSKSLMKKIKLTIKLLDVYEEPLKVNQKQLTEYDKIISRDYQNLKVVNLKENLIDNRKSLKKLFALILDKFAKSLASLHIVDCYMSRTDVINALKKFPNLVELKLDNVMFSDDFSPSELASENADEFALSCPQLKSFRLVNTDFFCFLLIKSHKSLQVLELSSPIYTRSDVEELEVFLLNQRDLKVLKLRSFRFNSTYSTNRLFNVPFQLTTLILDDVVWDINDNCSLFLKSQRSLKHFGLRYFQRWISPREEKFMWFCDVMKHVLIQNSHLESIGFNEFAAFSYLKDSEFLVGECNKKVKSLQYVRCRTSEESEFLAIASRLFPNIDRITISTQPDDPVDILQRLGSFSNLKSISITSKTANLGYLPSEIMENVTSFKFVCTDESKASILLNSNILSHCTKLEHLFLNIEPLMIEQITELIWTFTSTLKSLTIYNLYINLTEAEMIVQNFPQLKLISSDIRPSQEVRKFLNESNIDFKVMNARLASEDQGGVLE